MVDLVCSRAYEFRDCAVMARVISLELDGNSLVSSTYWFSGSVSGWSWTDVLSNFCLEQAIPLGLPLNSELGSAWKDGFVVVGSWAWNV